MRYMTIKQVIKSGKYPFTMGQLRELLFKREKNGLWHSVIKIGKTIYIKIESFDQWMDDFNHK